MDPATIAPILVLLGALTSLLGKVFERFLSKRKEDQQETLDQRVEKLGSSLSSAVQLISEIEGEIKERHALVEKLKADIEQNKQLVQLQQPQVEAVAQALRGQLETQDRRSFWRGVGVNFIFFALGAGVSIAVAAI